MAEFKPLGDFLRNRPYARTSMSINGIEKLIGSDLPAEARESDEWWNNGAPHTKDWTTAGWAVEDIDFESQKVVFKRQ